jgi:aspartyl-tRNA(Asn)/glutamyl-tRNA(Gln) amidotransferase subunit C
MGDAVSLEDVLHVAGLARLGLNDEQARALTKDLNTILEHMQVLTGVDTSRADASAGVGAAGMRLRPDHGPPIPLDEPPQALAPEMRDGFFVVPRLSTHEPSGGGDGDAARSAIDDIDRYEPES